MDRSLASLIQQARYAVAFTGAGVSTLSGLPDFRGKTGLYSNPEYARIFDLDKFHEDASFYYRHCQSLLYQDHDLKASLIHNELARLEADGTLKALITQNIDRLHQQAGSKRVIEVHGSPEVHRCLSCGTPFSYRDIQVRVQKGELPPLCACGGVIKPEITFFGESLPMGAFEDAAAQARLADVFLVLGTSLTVYPAASLPRLCLRHGGQVVIVNDQPTDLDDQATLRLWSLEEAFGA